MQSQDCARDVAIGPQLTRRNGFFSPPAPPGSRKWCSTLWTVCAEPSKPATRIGRPSRLEHLLRHSALWRTSDLPASDAQPADPWCCRARRESTAEFLIRAGAHGVTHISGTPSHWRRALMSPAARRIAPRYVRLSGEIADQSILDHLRSFYPQADVAHAFASTEAGVAFDVRDGLAGFPASLHRTDSDGVEMKVEDGSLRIRSSRTAASYIGPSKALRRRGRLCRHRRHAGTARRTGIISSAGAMGSSTLADRKFIRKKWKA